MRRFFLLVCAAISTSVFAQDSADWPQWRGPQREGVGGSTNLLQEWPEAGPKVKWKVDTAGVGYSSVAIADGRVFTQGDLDGVEHVIALSAEDGRVLWQVQPGKLGELLEEQVTQKLAQFDKNNDGELNSTEAIAAYGWNFTKYDRGGDLDTAGDRALVRAESLVTAFDANSDSRLDYQEVEKLRGLRLRDADRDDRDADVDALAKTRTAMLLKKHDGNGDGKISKEESRDSFLRREFNRVDQRDRDKGIQADELLTPQELLAYFKKFEGGRDGEVTVEELAEYLSKRFPAGDGRLTREEIRGIDGGYRNGMGDGPRGTPTVDGDRLYVEGGNGHVSCLDVATGETYWQVSLRDDFGGGRPGWGYSESPLVVEQMVIVTPGGKGGTLAALNKLTGELIWRTEAVTQSAHYSSPILAEIHGVRQVVQFAREGVFGASLSDGRKLWSYGGAANGTANCATPIVHNNHVFSSSAYGTGGGLCRVEKTADGLEAKEVYFDKKMANHHGGIVRLGDYMYGFGSGGLICMEFMTGKHAWSDRSVGKGSLIASDGLLFLLGERHTLGLAKADPTQYVEAGRISLESQGRPSWAHPAIAQGVLYVRDQQSLTAYDVSK